MKYIFAIYDNATESFNAPMTFRARGEAIRAFTNEAQNNTSQINLNPADFELWLLSTWDEQTGEFTNCKERVLRAIDVQKGE